MARLDPVVGSEQGGRRPVLIVQNDLGNRRAPTVIAVPLTASPRKPPLLTHVRLEMGEGGCASRPPCCANRCARWKKQGWIGGWEPFRRADWNR